jgi:hypothetical protein
MEREEMRKEIEMGQTQYSKQERREEDRKEENKKGEINLYYYIKHLRIGGFIFCHCKFLLYPFYPSIRRIIFIIG